MRFLKRHHNVSGTHTTHGWHSVPVWQYERTTGEMVQLPLAKEEAKPSGRGGWLVPCCSEPQLCSDLSHSPVALSTTSLGQGS